MKSATFAERLKTAMDIRNLSVSELSRKTGISKAAISRYTHGQFEAAQTNLDKLATALDVSIPWLMGADVPMGARFKKPSSTSRQALFDLVQSFPEEDLSQIYDILVNLIKLREK